MNGIHLSLGVLIVCSFIGFSVTASVPLSDYAKRLTQAEESIDKLTEGEHGAGEVLTVINSVKQLLPQEDEVDFDGRPLRVDNRWLHDEIDKVIKELNGDVEQRRSMLVDIARRLHSLRERVTASESRQNIKSDDQRARLEGILARSDYRPEVKKESTLKKWFRMFWDALARFLNRFDRSPGREFGGAGTGTITVIRIVIALIVVAATVFGLIRLLKHLRPRRKSKQEGERREVLGEEIAGDVTAADLLAEARELARHGDFRTAIRRAYIAALFELEQCGKLRLHRSKTNRDYLEALRPEREIFPFFSQMTGTFENVWYGQMRATEDEFNVFISRYQETVK